MLNKKNIIDTHFHIWDSNVLDIPWLSLFDGKLKKKYSLNNYFRAINGLNIVLSCYEEVDAIKAQHKKEAQMILQICEDSSNQIVGATIAADLSSPGFKQYISTYASNASVKSVRHNFFAADAKITATDIFQDNVNFLAKLGIMCDLVMPSSHILYGVDLVQACPNTLFVVNHCGVCPMTADELEQAHWIKGIEGYAKNDNTICKISEFGFTNPDYKWQIADVIDKIRHCIDSFGPDRVVYGTNWPVCEMTASISKWIEAIESSLEYYPDDYANQLFYENAKRLYYL